MNIKIIFYRFMPESPRWLIAHNRRKEAKILIDKASKMNRIDTMSTVSLTIEKQELRDTNDITLSPKLTSKSMENKLQKNIIKGFQVLISNGELRKRILITNFTWMTASLTYYALGKHEIGLSIFQIIKIIFKILLAFFLLSNCCIRSIFFLIGKLFLKRVTFQR